MQKQLKAPLRKTKVKPSKNNLQKRTYDGFGREKRTRSGREGKKIRARKKKEKEKPKHKAQ
jgi:hypothetical protein